MLPPNLENEHSKIGLWYSSSGNHVWEIRILATGGFAVPVSWLKVHGGFSDVGDGSGKQVSKIGTVAAQGFVVNYLGTKK